MVHKRDLWYSYFADCVMIMMYKMLATECEYTKLSTYFSLEWFVVKHSGSSGLTTSASCSGNWNRKG